MDLPAGPSGLSIVADKLRDSIKGSKRGNERKERKKAAYAYLKKHFNITKYILESGHKLRLPPLAIASACVLYHRFWRTWSQMGNDSKQAFDAHLIGATVLYLASKAEESPRKIRDVINVCHRSLHKDVFLEVGSEYWDLRDSVVNCELFVLRVLGFKVATDNPHKYLLHFLKLLQDWVKPDMWQLCNISQISWTILCDSVHVPIVLDQPPSHVAIAVVFFGVLCTGMEIPSEGAKTSWWKAMCDTINIEEIQGIIGDLMNMYDFENKPLIP